MTEQAVKILLVDDRQEDLLALEVVLSNENYEFYKGNSGRDALRILLKEQDFAIILIDIQMPLMDGFETATLIRENEKLKNIPIIFLTANNDSQDNIFKGYQKGAVDYLIKPVVPEILTAKVSVFVDLYKKNRELIAQKQSLTGLYRELAQRSEELARSNKELEKFAYVASHDMQEPIRTMVSFIQLLELKIKNNPDEETKQYMDFVVSASHRMRDLITGLLQYARINREEKPFEEVDCKDVVNEVIENLHSRILEEKVIIEADSLPVITADYVQIVQLFQNLIVNAIKFRSKNSPVIKISSRKADGSYLFSIEDNGIGIEQKHADRIFEIFQRLHPLGEYDGTGIGLAICKKIVERFKGKIWMESVKEKGTTFYFTIPLSIN
jgi:signal transduction histidine kinase